MNKFLIRGWKDNVQIHEHCVESDAMPGIWAHAGIEEWPDAERVSVHVSEPGGERRVANVVRGGIK